MPRDNRSSSLRKAKLKEAVNGSFEGAEKKEVIVLTETLTSQRPLRQKPVAKTMTIKEIQQRLNSLIKGDFPIRLIGLISANHETINKEINSDNNKIIDLVDKAANVKATSKGKTAYQMAEDKDNKEFLEVVDNARKRLAELKNRQSKSKLEKVDEVCKEPQIVPQSVAPQVTNLNRSDSRTLNDLTEENLTIEDIRLELECFINNKSSSDILSLISNNYWAIRRAINLSNTSIMELILQAAAIKSQKLEEVEDVEREEVEGAELEEDPEIKDTNIDKEQSNVVLQEKVQRVLDKLIELRKKDENFLTLTYFEKTDEIYEEQERRPVKSCPDLTTLGSAPSVEEGGKNNEEETPVDVVEESDVSTAFNFSRFRKLGGNAQEQKEQPSVTENKISSPFERTKIKRFKRNNSVGVAASEPSTDQDLHESDSDDSGMGGSPVSSPKKEGMESPQSSRRNSLLSNTGSDTEEISNPQTKSKTPPKPTLRISLQKQPDKKVSSAPTEAEPTPVVIPAPTTRVTLPPQEKEPALDAAKAPDRVTKEPKVIKPEEEKENTLRVRQKPAANRNSDKDISLKKQSNDRSFCFAATTISTLGAIACFATASIYIMSAKKANPVFSTSSIAVIGALFLIGIGFAATAGITWCLTPPPPPSRELSPVGLTHQAAKRAMIN